MADPTTKHERSADCVFPTCLSPNHWPTEAELAERAASTEEADRG